LIGAGRLRVIAVVIRQTRYLADYDYPDLMIVVASLSFAAGAVWTVLWLRMVQDGIAFNFCMSLARGREDPYFEISRSNSSAAFWLVIIFQHVVPATFLVTMPLFGAAGFVIW